MTRQFEGTDISKSGGCREIGYLLPERNKAEAPCLIAVHPHRDNPAIDRAASSWCGHRLPSLYRTTSMARFPLKIRYRFFLVTNTQNPGVPPVLPQESGNADLPLGRAIR
ncbi:hypothetical protein [Pontibaca salina]|uniref:Uncharacterized protein n=1 Tax=Pontibaca salina TaxID=2795731 RepID=A0A934HPW3_9RHOB|nr:hypothetical protein [Pontibaca salina]MBI6629537.1 hypothetical protein [Pontibaca salina]